MGLVIAGFGGAGADPGPTAVPWTTGDIENVIKMIDGADQGQINVADYWSIGQERLVDGVSWVLTDFNGTTSGGTAYNAIIHTKNTIENFGMNTSNTNAGGWSSSNMRVAKMELLYNALNARFRSMIKQVVNISGAGSASDTIQSTLDHLWLFSEKEVQGAATYSGSQEAARCKQMAYFKIANNKKKTGSGTSWWLRSPDVSSSRIFCYVFSDGSPNGASASYTFGVVAAAAI